MTATNWRAFCRNEISPWRYPSPHEGQLTMNSFAFDQPWCEQHRASPHNVCFPACACLACIIRTCSLACSHLLRTVVPGTSAPQAIDRKYILDHSKTAWRGPRTSTQIYIYIRYIDKNVSRERSVASSSALVVSRGVPRVSRGSAVSVA